MQKFLPITDVAIEINRFAFLSLEDPSISGVDFQNGPLKGYDDLNAAVEDLQDGHCLMCNSPIEHRHHIVPRSMQGSNTIGNIVGLCCKCHERVHKDTRFEDRLKKKESRAGQTLCSGQCLKSGDSVHLQTTGAGIRKRTRSLLFRKRYWHGPKVLWIP